jgi:hypothetical protein
MRLLRKIRALFVRTRKPLPPDPFGEPPREAPAARDPFFEGVKAATGHHHTGA